jgi:hypothetical protein
LRGLAALHVAQGEAAVAQIDHFHSRQSDVYAASLVCLLPGPLAKVVCRAPASGSPTPSASTTLSP